MFIKLDRDYEVKTTLGTIRDIEKSFNKPFFDVVNEISKMKMDDQMRLLYIGAKKADNNLTQEDFFSKCEEYLGIGDLFEYLEKYFYSLQYPGLSDEEVQSKIQKKLQQSRDMQQNRALTGNP